MNRFLTIVFAFAILSITLSGCGNPKINRSVKEAKALNEEGAVYERLKVADDLFEKSYYYQAIQLYEIIINELILKEDLAEVYFKYASCFMAQENYETASSWFNTFYMSYPDHPSAETAYFNKAVCTYELAENDYRLDPTNLVEASKEFQDYLINYPDGEFVTLAHENIEKIRITREKKELENAKLYLNIGEYKAAIEEFDRFIEDNPQSELVENAYFHQLEARYKLAKNSIEAKQKARFERVFTEYKYFMEKYPIGQFGKEITELFDEAKKDYNKLYKNEQNN